MAITAIGSVVISFLTVGSLIWANPACNRGTYSAIPGINTSENITLTTTNPEANADNTTDIDHKSRRRFIGSLTTLRLIENDIMNFDRTLVTGRHRRTIFANNSLLWPSKHINYVIAQNVPNHYRCLLLEGMKMIENACCIRFHEIQAADVKPNEDYFQIRSIQGEGCYSELALYCRGEGRYCVPHLNLDNPCNNKGHICHELMHMLGFVHEQNRQDSKYYVKIMYENIVDPEGVENLEPFSDSLREDTPYDFDSIMHYGLSAYAKAGTNTILPIAHVPPGVNIGHYGHLSEMDIVRLNRYYCGVVNDHKPINNTSG